MDWISTRLRKDVKLQRGIASSRERRGQTQRRWGAGAREAGAREGSGCFIYG